MHQHQLANGRPLEPALLSREEFWAYLNVKPSLGKRVLAEHPELIVRIGDRVLIPRARADAFIEQLSAV